MSTRFVLSWIGPTIERDVETNRYATFLQNTLGRIQADLQIDAVKVSDFSAGKRRVEAEITLTTTDASLDRIREWIVERMGEIPGGLPGVLMVSPAPDARIEP